MLRLLISCLFILLFAGCSMNRVEIESIKKLPHYNKDKANVYFINNERVLTFDIEYLIEFYSLFGSESLSVCYNQYSYHELEEGDYSIGLTQYKENHIFGSREDHEKLETYFKKGKIYILKPDPENDLLSIVKFLFTDVRTGNSLVDPILKLKFVEQDEALNKIDKIIKFKDIFGRRVIPARADENSCNDYIIADIKNWFE